ASPYPQFTDQSRYPIEDLKTIPKRKNERLQGERWRRAVLRRDGKANRGFWRFRITLARAPDHFWRRNQLGHRLQGRLFKNDRAVTYLHLARDVQIVAGIGLWQIPAILGQSRQRGHRKEQERE